MFDFSAFDHPTEWLPEQYPRNMPAPQAGACFLGNVVYVATMGPFPFPRQQRAIVPDGWYEAHTEVFMRAQMI
jgi:hypothetical protein